MGDCFNNKQKTGNLHTSLCRTNIEVGVPARSEADALQTATKQGVAGHGKSRRWSDYRITVGCRGCSAHTEKLGLPRCRRLLVSANGRNQKYDHHAE